MAIVVSFLPCRFLPVSYTVRIYTMVYIVCCSKALAEDLLLLLQQQQLLLLFLLLSPLPAFGSLPDTQQSVSQSDEPCVSTCYAAAAAAVAI